MEGSLYPNGVLVDQAALRRTETTKSAQIQLNRVDLTSRGVSSGGVVSAGATNGNYRVEIFAGYTPRGDYIESVAAHGDEVLSDATVGVINYIYAIYTETNTKSQPHETDGTSYPTYSRGSYTLKALTSTEYAALSATDDNLANDAKDRCLLLAKVTANSTSAITTIVHPTTYDNILYATPNPLSTITGITITGISPDTDTGAGTVDYTWVSPTAEITWASYGASAGGTANISAGGTFTVTDSASNTITVEVVESLLPTTASLSETVTIENLYYQEIPRQTAEDTLHRTRVGTGFVTAVNPHGNDLDDFGSQRLSLLDEHQDVMHSNGIWSGSPSTLFDASITTSGDDTLDITVPALNSVYYINGKKVEGISTANTITFDAATVVSLGGIASDVNYFEIYVDDAGALVPKLRAKYQPSRTCDGTSIIDMSVDHAADSCVLKMELGVSDYTFTWDGGAPVVIEASILSFASSYRVIRLYRPDGVQWVDVCLTNSTGGIANNYLPTAGGPYSDTVTVLAVPDLDQHMRIWSFPYRQEFVSGNGLIGYPSLVSTPGSLVDHRVRGTLGTSDIADGALEELIYRPTHDYNVSGIVNNRTAPDWSFQLKSFAGTTANDDYYLTGGEFYCNGKKIVCNGLNKTEVGIIPDGKTTIYWVDMDGVVHNHDQSTVGSLADNLYYILGSSYVRDSYRLVNYSLIGTPYEADRPQQGVPLVAVTVSGANVTDICYISRAVGPHVEPWTVASRDTSVDAEYSSLYVAFAYAQYLEDLGADGATNLIDITVVGDNTVDRSITQPTNTNVRGVPDSSNATTTISYSSPTLTGAWIMSAGNKIEGLKIAHTASTPYSVAIKLTNACEVSRCNVVSTAVNHFLGSTSAVGAVVTKNRLTTVAGLFSEATGSTPANNISWIVSDNYVIQSAEDTSAGTDYTNGMINLGGVGHTISGNNILTLNSAGGGGDYTPAINGYMTMCTIDSNIIFVTPGDGSTCYEAGIWLFKGSKCTISNNRVFSNASNTCGIGIVVGPEDNTVTGNNLSLLGMGILALSDTSTSTGLSNLTITDNTIIDFIHRGITVSPVGEDSSNINISNNSISDSTKALGVSEMPNNLAVNTSLGYANATSGLIYLSTDIRSIEVYQLSDAFDAFRKNFSITNNTIKNINLATIDGVNTAIYYHVEVLGSSNKVYDNINISNNSIRDLESAGGTSSKVYGIWFYFDGDVAGGGGTVSVCRNISINSNNISLGSLITSTQQTRGIYAFGNWVSAMTITSNVITAGYPEVNLTYYGLGIFANNTNATCCNISGNSILALWEGITTTTGIFSISNNDITTYSQGIVSYDTHSSITGNNIIIYSTDNENVSYGGYGSHGIMLASLTTTRRNVSVISNTVKYAPVDPVATSHTVLKDSACLYVAAIPGSLTISSNLFTNTEGVSAVNVGSGGTDEPSLVHIKARGVATVADFLDINFSGNNLIVTEEKYWGVASDNKLTGLLIDENYALTSGSTNTIFVRDNTIRSPEVTAGTDSAWDAAGNNALAQLFIRDSLGAGSTWDDMRGVTYVNNMLFRDHVITGYVRPNVYIYATRTSSTNLREKYDTAPAAPPFTTW